MTTQPDGFPEDRQNWYTATEYRGVLESLRISDAQKRMLVAHGSAPNLSLSVQELADAAGYAEPNIVYSQYGRLGHLIADALGYAEQEHVWTRLIGVDWRAETGQLFWELEPALARAMLRMGWIKEAHKIQSAKYAEAAQVVAPPAVTPVAVLRIYPDEVNPAGRYAEGATRAVMINAYERNAAARKECLRLFGATCAACDFDFEKVYGPIGTSFIHVHHLRKIASRGEQYIVDPKNDLIPVCPNCHAMLHTSDPPLSVTQLKENIATRSRADVV